MKMFFAKIKNGTAVEYPISESMLRKALSHTSLPAVLSPACLDGTGFVCVNSAPASAFPTVDRDYKAAISSITEGNDGYWNAAYGLVAVPDADKAKLIELQWKNVRGIRAKKFEELDALIAKTNREIRMHETPEYSIAALDAYGKALADITEENDPFLLVWPVIESQT